MWAITASSSQMQWFSDTQKTLLGSGPPQPLVPAIFLPLFHDGPQTLVRRQHSILFPPSIYICISLLFSSSWGGYYLMLNTVFFLERSIKLKVTEERIIKAIISLWEETGVVFLLDGIIPCVWERIKELLVARRGQRIHFTILLKWAPLVNHLLGIKTFQRRNWRKWLSSRGRSGGKVGTPHTLRYTLNLGNHYLHRNLMIKHPSALTLSPGLVWLLDGLFIGLWHSRVYFSLKKCTGLIWNMIWFSELICFLTIKLITKHPNLGRGRVANGYCCWPSVYTVAGLPCYTVAFTKPTASCTVRSPRNLWNLTEANTGFSRTSSEIWFFLPKKKSH